MLKKLEKKGVEGVIQLSCEPEQNGPLKLVPVGQVCDPEFMRFSEMQQAIKAVLRVLDALHKMNLCHCDVRWPNVIFDVKKNTFVLIDFEYVRKVGSELPSIKPKFIPEGLQKWDVSGDLYQVVRMIQSWAGIHEINFSPWKPGCHETNDVLKYLESLSLNGV